MRKSTVESRSGNRNNPESTEPGRVPGWGWGGQRSLEGRTEVELKKKRRGAEAGEVFNFVSVSHHSNLFRLTIN